MIKVGARKCSVAEISLKDATDFLNKYHRQKSVYALYNIGLFHDSILIAVITFGYPRYNKNYQWELLRLCFHPDYKVTGGTQKMFQFFLNKYKPHSIISYCDYNYFTGNVYDKLGFSLLRVSKGSKIWHKNDRFITDNLLRQYGADKLIGTHDGKGTNNEEIMLREGWQYKIDEKGQGTYIWNGEGKFGYIYLITDTLHNKQYIGQKRGYKLDENYYGSGKIIKDLIKHHGIEIFKREIIDYASSQEELSRKEIYYISHYNTLWPNGYNLTIRMQAIEPYESKTNCTNEISRKKQSTATKNLWKDKNYKEKVRCAIEKYWQIEENKIKQKEIQKRITSSEEYKQKMSACLKEKWKDKAYRTNVETNKNRVVKTQEFKNKCSERNKKRYENPIEREKARERMLNLWKNEEFRNKCNDNRNKILNDPIYRKKLSEKQKALSTDKKFIEKMKQVYKDKIDTPEYRKKLSEAAKGRKWYNNGKIQVFRLKKPEGEEWILGRLKKNNK